MKLNTDKEKVFKIIEAIFKNNMYCPCRIDKKQENLCPCNEFIQNEICKCKLFV